MNLFRSLRYVICFFFVLMQLTAGRANAGVIRLDYVLDVTQVLEVQDEFSPVVGNRFFLTMLVDDRYLHTDGVDVPGKILAFDTSIGPTRFTKDGGSIGNSYAALRGPCYSPALNCTPGDKWVLGSDSLGFEVANGNLTGIWGGVLDGADASFIDFYGDTFSARSYFLATSSAPAVDRFSRILGTITLAEIAVVPEPGTLFLFLLGGAGFLISRRVFSNYGLARP